MCRSLTNNELNLIVSLHTYTYIISMLDLSTFHLMPLISSLVINTIVTWLVVHFFYYPKGRRRDYYFTFILLSVSIFMLIALLMRDAHDVGIGAALGLFAIFGIIRYRTESVPIREMTYLFFLVALSVINGKCTGTTLSWLEGGVVNVVFIVCVWLCENFLTTSHEGWACLELLDSAGLRAPVLESLLRAVQLHLDRRACGAFRVGAVLFSNQHGPLGATDTAAQLLNEWKEH